MKKIYFPILILLAALGFLSIYQMSSAGIGASPDSVDYLSIARSLAAGDGYRVGYRLEQESEASAHFPPLFPALVAGVSKLTASDAWPAARWLNSMLFGLNVFLAGWFAGRATGNRLVAWVVSLLVLCSTDMLMVHAMAWSEPVFLTLMLTGFFLLAEYMDRASSPWLIAAAAVCGLALIARYAGVTLLMTGVFVLLFRRGPARGRRLADALVFGGIGSLPMAMWLVKNMTSTGSATNRSLVFHPVGLEALEEGLSTFSKWLIPDFLDTRIRIVVFIIILGALVLGAWKSRLPRAFIARMRELAYARVAFHFLWIYPVFLLFYISWCSVGTYFNYRIMLPMLLCLLLWVPLLFAAAREVRWFRIFLLLLLASYPVRAAVKIVETHRLGGLGYAASAWRDGATMDWIRTYQGPGILLSNGREPTYLLTRKIVGRLPRKIIYAHGTTNPAYQKEWQAMELALQDHGGYLVLFDALRGQKMMPDVEELKHRLPLREHAVFNDGIVYHVPGLN
jgi:hypothetical protein